jgi:hypothetical protein
LERPCSFIIILKKKLKMKFTAVAALMAAVSAEAAAAAPDCTIAKFEVFSDAKCATPLAEAEATPIKTTWETLVKSKACILGVTNVCDAAGITSTKFAAKPLCTADADATKDVATVSAWGACVEVTKDKVYFKATSARAILAGSAAILAFAASQF